MRIWQNFTAFAAMMLLVVLFAFPATAGPYMLVDLNSGKVLAEKDAFKRWYPASLTKLMTAYVALRAVKSGEIQMNSPIRISQNATAEPPSKMGYAPGTILTLDNALKIILVKSANDVATAFAESVGGTEAAFVARMNREASRLGMFDTHFANAHGLHSVESYSTARDLAVLVRAIRTEFPQYAGYFAIEGLQTGEKVLENYNLLIGRFRGADGMKTGFVCAAGFNLIATATRDGRTLAAIILGADSQVDRAEKAAELLEKGFQESGNLAPTLTSLRPSDPNRHAPTNMRSEICSAEAYAERSKERDEEGELIISSPYMRSIGDEEELNLVQVETGGAAGPETVAPRISYLPVPTPRPQYRPGERIAAGGEGS